MNINEIKHSGHRFGDIEFLTKQVVEGFITGLHQSPYHGFSVEFAEHRQYNTSESTRHIDWKVYAKSDRLFVKKYEEETNLRCTILLDVSSSMYYPEDKLTKLKFSILSASTIAHLLQKQRDAVGLVAFDEEIILHTPVKSTSKHLHELMLQMHRLFDKKSINHKTKVYNVLNTIAEKIHKRSLVILFSDMFEDMLQTDELLNALKHLKHMQHEVIVFHVKDKNTELEFEFEDRPTMFVDIETGEKIKVNPAQIKKSYKESLLKFSNEIKLKCGNFKIDYIEIDANQDFKQVLMPFLIKRSKM
ncbi:MAG: DUF58 domain-containing protein [Bacteroidota bacterium]|nr:DUF58 domain-containing protein [Bacteroidota bacterium]